MGFFSREIRKPDEVLLQMMSNVGSQMGLFVERKRAERALRESEARLKLAMESARMGYWELEVDTRKVTRSEGLERILGVTPGSLKSNQADFLAMVHPEDREKIRLRAERALQTTEISDSEYRIVRPDGSIRWIAGPRPRDFWVRWSRLGIARVIYRHHRAQASRGGATR